MTDRLEQGIEHSVSKMLLTSCVALLHVSS
jgi:hypothetical protein